MQARTVLFNSVRLFVAFLLVCLWSSVSAAQVGAKPVRSDAPSPAGQTMPAPSTPIDLRALKAQIETFQGLVNRSIRQEFEWPFALLQDAKGMYLPGFGVAFHVEVNLYTLRILTPFDMRPHTPEELQKGKEAKLERIRALKGYMTDLLREHGGALSAVAPEQNIAIVVHLFNLPSESRELPTQVVISIRRGALLDHASRSVSADEFHKAGLVLEF